ncbi:MAG: aldo/keto reductase [Alphaproteobacteria bacterium]|nr:aldo/keto reductase [Alphaproteobacteria bacterium]
MSIEKRAFGRTGHMSSAVIFGAAALKNVDQATADRTLDLLYRFGVNHIDTAPRYGDAELRIGPWMERARDDFFLATKTDQFDYAGCKAQIQRSLERLRTNRLDLLQLHCLIHPDDWERAFAPGGAMEAILEAKTAGQVDHIGVTGHGWTVAAMHRKSLERFDFDSVLMPWNWFSAQHPSYARDFKETVALCERNNVAIQTIKSIARGPWSAGATQNRNTWYQPLEDEDDIRTAVHWLLSHPGFFLNSVGDVGLLPYVLQAADEFGATTPEPAVMVQLNERAGLSSIFGL